MQRMASTGSSADAFAERRFRLEGRKHTRQYAQLYFYRLSLVRARYARTHTQNDATRLRDARGKPHVVIATVYKEQKLKPDVLSAYTKVQTDRDRQTERERDQTRPDRARPDLPDKTRPGPDQNETRTRNTPEPDKGQVIPDQA